MLIKLTGQVSHRGDGYIILERDGLGYRVFVGQAEIYTPNQPMTLFLHEQVREDERVLFGFPTIEALEVFWRFLEVSGVGAKSAQKIVTAAPIDEVRTHLVQGNLSFFTGVPGIGKKTAQKILLELQGMMVAKAASGPSPHEDVIMALVHLGYARALAEEAVKEVSPDGGEAQMIRDALRLLQK